MQSSCAGQGSLRLRGSRIAAARAPAPAAQVSMITSGIAGPATTRNGGLFGPGRGAKLNVLTPAGFAATHHKEI